jgi:hypothetical protein
MPPLTEQQISDFKRLWRERFGNDITTEEARDKGLRLVRLLKVVLDATAERPNSDLI